MNLFLSMLKGREKDYPVFSVFHMVERDVSDLPEEKPVVRETLPSSRAEAVRLGVFPASLLGKRARAGSGLDAFIHDPMFCAKHYAAETPPHSPHRWLAAPVGKGLLPQLKRSSRGSSRMQR